MSVVLPASGWLMIAKVLRRSVSRARRVSGVFEGRGSAFGRSVLVIYTEITISRAGQHQLDKIARHVLCAFT